MAKFYLFTIFVLGLGLYCTADEEDSTVKNDKCTFPFTYRGSSYNYCTKVNSNRLWCSVKGIYDGKWEYCEESKEDSGDKFTELFAKLKEQERKLREAEASNNQCRCHAEIKNVYKSIDDIERIISDHQRRVSGLEQGLDKVESAEEQFQAMLPNLQKVLSFVTKY